ncbi:S-adenosyl-L-methionine-dependent methyltransferase [Thelonectria olida]|uniref:S-adenosyl-L-methionine-dependent methyltransferase n=1 Tax=Thelonectria olida TaxID=1576542 RepID=A0A9P8WDD9_9HYPO|nr:S-adenosyl-L-methionine-dependent methyltransferase [Thelonectria olida]
MDTEDGTVPLDETFTEIVEYHGRSYQQYALTNGTYFVPVDEDEIARLEVLHGVLNSLFDNRLIFPPVRSPRRILDCGCGSGDWAVDVAMSYPNAEVLGIDVSPHMIPESPPDNLDLQVDDLNGRFTFQSNYFDVVHSQMMAGGIHANRWRSYMRDIFRVTRPGGWCQMVEIYFNAQSDNGSLTRDHALSRWSRLYLQSAQPYKDPRAPLQMATWMRSAGFTEIESRLLMLPMCAWSNEARDYNIGWANNENVNQMLSSLALYPMTQFLGMSVTDFQLLVAQARSEAGNPALKLRVYRPEAPSMMSIEKTKTRGKQWG